jgi:tetratricopeptide (TPR) repeat protein
MVEWKMSKEELAQKAMEFLDSAERFEESKEWYKAIEHYQKAAEYLQQSGYLTHRIEDLYTRATEINNYIKQQRAYEAAQAHVQKAQLDQLQEQAFTLLDDAKAHENSGNLQNAIKNYLDAIKLLS